MQKPIRQEVAEWKQHKVTKYLVERLIEDAKDLKDLWAEGSFTGADQSITIQLNSRAIGQYAAIAQMLEFIESDMDIEEMVKYEH